MWHTEVEVGFLEVDRLLDDDGLPVFTKLWLSFFVLLDWLLLLSKLVFASVTLFFFGRLFTFTIFLAFDWFFFKLRWCVDPGHD